MKRLMRKLLRPMGAVCVAASWLMSAPASVAEAASLDYEWWLDSDVSNINRGTAVGESVRFSLPLGDVAPGLHMLNMRTVVDGKPGPITQHAFMKSYSVKQVDGYEWWLDGDSDHRQRMSLTSATEHFSVPLHSIDPGLHTLNVRALVDGQAGPVAQHMFLTTDMAVTTGYEYWLDDDYQSRTVKNIAGATEHISLEMPKLAPGLHTFCVRAFNSRGQRGVVFQHTFVTTDTPIAAGYEYWFDDDIASLKSVPAAGGQQTIPISMEGLDAGLHRLCLRAYNGHGQRGPVMQYAFMRTHRGEKLSGYRLFARGKEMHYKIDPPSGAAEQTFVFPIPLQELPSGAELAASLLQHLKIADGYVSLESLEASEEITIQMQLESGRWLAPETQTLTVRGPKVPARDLTPYISLDVPKPASSGIEAVRFSIAEAGKWYLRGWQDATMFIVKEGASLLTGKLITAEQLRAGAELQLTAGDWYGVIANAPVDEANPLADVTLRLANTPQDILAAPSISFENGQVTLSAPNPDAEIRYTLDGATPDETSTLYTEPFAVTRNLTVQARAFAAGWEPSPVSRLVIDSYTTPEPSITVSGLLIAMKGEQEGDSIYYTLDGSDPRQAGGSRALYAGEIDLPRRDVTIKAYAQREGWNASEVATEEVKVAERTVDTPRIRRTETGVEMTCTTDGAEIRYTDDGSDPTETSFLYEGVIPFSGNKTYAARAYAPGMFPSPIDYLTIGDFTTPAPSITVSGLRIAMKGEQEGDSIYYTLDGSDPRQAGGSRALYAGEIDLPRRDVTIKAYAQREGWNASEVVTEEVKVADHTVATPAITRTAEGIAMTCTTKGAEIRYTTDGTEPTETSLLYETVLPYAGNLTYMARAYAPYMFESGVYRLSVDDQGLPAPTAAYGGRHVTLTCADAPATIRYTTDGSDPRGESGQQYTGPIPMSSDCTVRHYAHRDGFNDSEEGAPYDFRLADHRMSKPSIEPSYRAGTLTFRFGNEKETDAESRIHVAIAKEDGTSATLIVGDAHEMSLDASDPVASVTATAITNEDEDPEAPAFTPAEGRTLSDLYPSEPVTFRISYCEAPTVDYDGMRLTVTAPEGAVETLSYKEDGEDATMKASTEPVRAFYQLEVRTVSDTAFPSSPVRHSNDAWSALAEDGSLTVALKAPGALAANLGWTSRHEEAGPTVAELLGYWSKDDYDALGEAFDLTDLDLTRVNAVTLPRLDAMGRLHTLMLPVTLEEECAPLAGLTGVTSILWSNPERPMPEGVAASAHNPNMIVYVTTDGDATAVAPADAPNVAILTSSITGADAELQGALELHEGHPFRAAWTLHAGSVRLTHEFGRETPGPDGEDKGYGWETIALPFDAESITTADGRTLTPFAAFDGDREAATPFWAYEADAATGWKAAGTLKAGVPYIVAMPNNAAYVESANVAGAVTFAAEDVTFTPEATRETPRQWSAGTYLHPRFYSTDAELEEWGEPLTLNRAALWSDGWEYQPGGAFAPPDMGQTEEARHFGAYVTVGDGRRLVSVWGDKSRVTLPQAETLRIEAGDGYVILTSCETRTVTIHTASGMHIATLGLEAETPSRHTLAAGVYIIDGRKILVR